MTAAEEDRSQMIIDDDSDEENDALQSDLVRLVLNLGYLPKKRAQNFSFDKNAVNIKAFGNALLKGNFGKSLNEQSSLIK